MTAINFEREVIFGKDLNTLLQEPSTKLLQEIATGEHVHVGSDLEVDMFKGVQPVGGPTYGPAILPRVFSLQATSNKTNAQVLNFSWVGAAERVKIFECDANHDNQTDYLFVIAKGDVLIHSGWLLVQADTSQMPLADRVAPTL